MEIVMTRNRTGGSVRGVQCFMFFMGTHAETPDDEGAFTEGGFSVNHGMHCIVINCVRR